MSKDCGIGSESGCGISRGSAGILLALVCSLVGQQAMAAEAQAQKPMRFTFIDAEYARMDVDKNETLVVGSDTLSLETDDDRGYRIAGAWQIIWNFHVFGEYSKAENDFEASLVGPAVNVQTSEKFDLGRARLGLGYGLPLGQNWLVYSRVTWDYIDVDNITVGPLSLGDDDDTGVGAELGLRWRLLPSVELQGYGRYSGVGELDVEEGFDDDVLGGIKARWNAFGSEELAFQMGYEFGDISTLNLGVRFMF